MKSLIIAGSALCMLMTTVEPIFAADEASTSRSNILEEVAPVRLSDLNMHLNPQIGVSSFEYSGKTGAGKTKFTGGATVEFGSDARKFETGLLILQSGADVIANNGQSQSLNVTYLTLPMMAKLRVLAMRSQTWYAKFGAMTAIVAGSSNRDLTSGADVMASLGVGGRFAFNRKSDFIVEATYNRGLLESVETSHGVNYAQGFMVLAGLSFSL